MARMPATPGETAPRPQHGAAAAPPSPTGDGAVLRRVGVMGGTFDPVHHGHLVAASEVADRFDLDTVVFVPTGEPWQKKDRKVTEAEDRYLMTVIATASNPRFTVSRVDIDRPGPTYTIDTLHDLTAQFPGAELFFITGADALRKIVTWRDWEQMFDRARLCSASILFTAERSARTVRLSFNGSLGRHRKSELTVCGANPMYVLLKDAAARGAGAEATWCALYLCCT